MRRFLVPLLLVIGLAACATDKPDPPDSPALSLVGQGLTVDRAPLPAAFTEPEIRSQNSLWAHNNQGLFRDLRARKVGDVVTVTIDINDQAQFDNQSGRSRQGSAKGSFAAALGFEGFGISKKAADASGNFNADGSTNSKGAGSIDRSEKLHLSIAAVVTEVLPDGNLLVSGSQEVRVNHEIRVLNIAGIVRWLDIGANNVISYDKIAEARVSYGGRGKISDVQ
jgi:flagellar L-ring protein precursor FlgH